MYAMEIEVTKAFAKQLKKSPRLKRIFKVGVNKLKINPGRVTSLTWCGDIYRVELPEKNRLLAAWNCHGNKLIPYFIGSHESYNHQVNRGRRKLEDILSVKTVRLKFDGMDVNVNDVSIIAAGRFFNCEL